MRVIRITKRQCRLLRGNLTEGQAGYDFKDLKRLDKLAGHLTDLMGSYGEAIADMARQERAINRDLAREQITQEEHGRRLQVLQYDVEDLDEDASRQEVELWVDEAEHKLLEDKLNAQSNWLASDDLRPLIIGMVEAVKNAEHHSGEEVPADVTAERVANGRQDKVRELRRK